MRYTYAGYDRLGGSGLGYNSYGNFRDSYGGFNSRASYGSGLSVYSQPSRRPSAASYRASYNVYDYSHEPPVRPAYTSRPAYTPNHCVREEYPANHTSYSSPNTNSNYTSSINPTNNPVNDDSNNLRHSPDANLHERNTRPGRRLGWLRMPLWLGPFLAMGIVSKRRGLFSGLFCQSPNALDNVKN
ncbi:hypothetical protein CcaverHIS002_0201490 [Cutaneotrichosporon cavernicola]|uniref:Uncharacterized protein n=1 Tax=Cutaneotrichosporon cavernicola TaxID=279322 RepID=A0AA48KZM0_9TREE|nr:uncharacterized protein CcaverHIS019_0201530 [Cutaneotrichosporon cavernicola]BEI80989.1 hypothetical protein CcaverHIS002_0201490 [Cutaneotrichosporon cavernicola]BEI88791.1 hypothetical protein CcaverHIS019_0201530 [Cutaneotrichosporon cavernicola]BEI96566.1 hypothetical protein CcaverHIS631_0201550 [Cutaneotrichosporon cavernicola]BEJ04338.1 hypothetical protein CcaverHIS641_0201550 [Cutaneotrichosporon cavernicola]